MLGGAPEHPAEKRHSVASRQSHRSSAQVRSASRPDGADSLLPEGGAPEHPAGMHAFDSMESAELTRLKTASSEGGAAGHPAEQHDSNVVVPFSRQSHPSLAPSSAQATDC